MSNNDGDWMEEVAVEKIMNTMVLLNRLLINSMRIINTFIRAHMCVCEIKQQNFHPNNTNQTELMPFVTEAEESEEGLTAP